MYVSETKIRVRYSETDQMGYVYYGNYPAYFEVGRAEAMRELGYTYRQMEEKGVMMPIVSMSVKYKKPAFYDDLLVIRTTVKDLPTSRMHFFYEVINEKLQIVNQGETILAFIDVNKRRPCPAPNWLLTAMKPFFESST